MCVRTFSMRARTCLCLVSVLTRMLTRMHTYPVRGEPERRISSAPVLEEVEKQVDGPQDHKQHKDSVVHCNEAGLFLYCFPLLQCLGGGPKWR